MSRTSKAWEALQDRLSQAAETVTRSSRVDIVSGGVDEIDPPEDIDEFAELVKETGIVRANLRKFVNDVWEPGYRVEGPDETVQYFEGDKEDIDGSPPEDTPKGGFLSQAAVYGGEKHQDFYQFGKECTYQRWVRGTVLIEYLKADRTDPESEITGFHFIRPETVYPRVENNTNILLPPDEDDLPDDIDRQDIDLTPRDEVAAYVQFDDESVLGLRNNGFDKQDIPLSQNDVLKQTLEPDIGGDIGTAEGVFGTSVIEAINEDIEEYKQIKRDRAEAIGRKAYGIWTAQFTKETYEFGNTTEVVEWNDDAIKNTEKDLQDLGPGDVLTSDAGIDLKRFDGDVPELEPTLMHYVDDIMSALPAPKYLTGFEDNVNRDVASDQEAGYEDLISEERNVQEETWTEGIRTVAERKGLDTDGLELKIQPPKEDNPVKSLSTDEIDRMNTYVQTLNAAAGPQAGPTALVDGQEILEVMDFPESEATAQDMADEMAEMGDEAAQEAWQDIMDVDTSAVDDELRDKVESLESRIEALFDPIKHPRDPETGKFVERPYPVPDDIAGLDTRQIIGELAASNENFAEQVEGLAVDIPGDDDGSAVPTEIQELVDNPDAGSGGSVEGIESVNDFDSIDEGDVVRVNGRAFRVETTEMSEGGFGVQEPKLEGEYLDTGGQRRLTFERGRIQTAGAVADGTTTFGDNMGEAVEIRRVVETQYGPKLKIDSPFAAKDAIKSLDFDETHRSWNSSSETWDIDVDALDDAVETLNEEGFNVNVSNDLLQLEEVPQPN